MVKKPTNSSPRMERTDSRHPQPTPLRVFNLARNTWLEGKRISFENLSKEVGVSRVTLYRWQGSRDQLIENIIWSFAKPAFDRIREETAGVGVMHVVEVHRKFMTEAAGFEPMRRFVQANPKTSIRMQTLNANTAHGRLIEATADHLLQQESLGYMKLTLPAQELAELIVTTNAALLYGSIIRDEAPEDTIKHASTITYKLLIENSKSGRITAPCFEHNSQHDAVICYIN